MTIAGAGCGAGFGGAAETTARSILGSSYYLAELRSDACLAFAGSVVSAWGDFSGGSYGVSQGTGSKRPAYNTCQNPAGRPALTFDVAAAQVLRSASFTLDQPFTVFIAIRSRKHATTNRVFFDGYTASSTTMYTASSTGAVSLRSYSGVASVAHADNTWTLVRGVFNSSATQSKIAIATGLPTAGSNTGANAAGGYSVGGQPTGTYTGDCDISHVVLALGDLYVSAVDKWNALTTYMRAWNGV